MKSLFKKISLVVFIGIINSNCDSSADAITPTVVPDTFNHLCIKTSNSPVNSNNIWDFREDFGTTAFGLRRNDILTPLITAATIMSQQCSAYSKIAIQGSNHYVVSTGERVVVYRLNGNITSVQGSFPIANVQAMEFINGKFFMVRNNKLEQYDIFTLLTNPAFTPIAITPMGTSNMSNLAYNGNFLYVINQSIVYKIDTTGSGSIVGTFSLTTALYNGLEYVNNPNIASSCNNSLYVVQTISGINKLVRINEATGVNSVIANIPSGGAGTRLSSILDYTTEFYYLYIPTGFAADTYKFTVVDLSPASGTVNPVTGSAVSGYRFAYQLKD